MELFRRSVDDFIHVCTLISFAVFVLLRTEALHLLGSFFNSF